MYQKYYKMRSPLINSYRRISGGSLTVVWFGGSISCGGGSSDQEKCSFRAIVTEHLKNAYPDTEIKSINASIGGTGSDYASYRVDNDVIKHKPDLVFVEYPVNDHYPHINSYESIVEHYESIVLKIKRALPQCDIVVLLTNERATMTKPDYFAKVAHDDVAEHYSLPTIYIGDALGSAIGDSSNDERWGEYFGDPFHPNDAGHKVYADTIIEFLDNALTDKVDCPQKALPTPMSGRLHLDTSLILWSELSCDDSWSAKRVLHSSTVGARASCEFTGSCVSVMARNCTTGGAFRFYIDGNECGVVDLYWGYTLHPKIVLADNLQNGRHTLTLELVGKVNEKATDCEVNIIAVLADR